MLPGSTMFFLTFSIVLEVIRLIVLIIHTYTFIAPLLPLCHGLIVVAFLIQKHPTFLWHYYHIQPPEDDKRTLGCSG